MYSPYRFPTCEGNDLQLGRRSSPVAALPRPVVVTSEYGVLAYMSSDASIATTMTHVDDSSNVLDDWTFLEVTGQYRANVPGVRHLADAYGVA